MLCPDNDEMFAVLFLVGPRAGEVREARVLYKNLVLLLSTGAEISVIIDVDWATQDQSTHVEWGDETFVILRGETV